MKRARWARNAIVGGLFAVLAGCSGPPAAEDAPTQPAPDSGWTRPPEIVSVRRTGGSLVFAGAAEPGGRVVLRSAAGAAYAAAADERGRFEIRIAAPTGSLMLRPETQVGQGAAASPDRLLILDGGRGPVAVLRPGGPSRRLDAAPALGAIDSDGRAAIISGRSEAPERPVAVSAGGRDVQARPGGDGRWSLPVGLAPGAVVRVDGRDFPWPGPGAAQPGELQAERLASGWRVGWAGAGGAGQWTWLPTADPES